MNNIQYQKDITTTGDLLVLLLSIKYTDGCGTANCKTAFVAKIQKQIADVYNQINLVIKFTNGQTINVHLTFSSIEQAGTGKVFNHLSKIK
jgi:hypothetical protein